MIPEATGIVLAGGRSSRFGSDKALAPWAGGTMLDAVVRTLLEAGLRVIIVSKNQDRDTYRRPNVELIREDAPDAHPLVGLRAGLSACRSPWAFACACDMPLLKVDLVRRILAARQGWEAVVPVWGERAEPLCAAYSKSALPVLEESLLPEPRGPILDFARMLKTRWLEERELASADPRGASFSDVDDRRAWEALRA